jgi:glycosyltransferase involved in cell wall biosynthesis
MAGGGAERQVTYLVRELGRLGWEVHVAVVRRGPNWPRLEVSGAVVHELQARSSYDPRLLRQLRRLVQTVRPDLIQTWLLQMEVLAGWTALSTRTPWIFSERASADAYPPTVKNVLRRMVAARANAIVSNSAAGDEHWRAILGTRVRRYVVPNALPIEEIAQAPAARLETLSLRPDLPLLLFAGRLEAQKNIDVFLSALEIVLARHSVQVLCCGEGALRQRIDEWSLAHPSDGRFRVTGYASDLWGLMKQAAAFVSPSLFEGSPNVVLEAMAVGVPLVISDIPEHREILDETSALLVSPRSPSELAGAIETVLRDPGRAAERARAAKARVAQYGLGPIAQRYTEVYTEVLSGRRAQ